MQSHQSARSPNVSGMFGGGQLCFPVEDIWAQISTW